MNKSKRIFYFDFLRAMAIIGIIFCHSSTSFVVKDFNSINFYISAFFDCFRDFSVPIFVMLSGALLLNRKEAVHVFLKKRLTRIFIPFIFWAALYSIYSMIYITHVFDPYNILDLFLGHVHTFGSIFWFIWMIVTVYVGILIINQTIIYGEKRISDFDKKFISILTVLSLAYIVMFQLKMFSQNYYASILSYYISFISYAIIGYYIANTNFIESKITNKLLVFIMAGLSLFLYSSYICGYVVPSSIANNHFTYHGYFTIEILIISVCIFLTFKYMENTDLFKKIEKNKIGKIISEISLFSFGIYLSHYLILFRLKTDIIQFTDYANQSPLIWIPLLVLITLIISLIILKVLSKIPYLNKVTGY